MNIHYTAIVIITAFAMLVMMVALYDNNLMSPTRKNGFMCLFLLLIIVNVAEWLAAFLDGANTGLRTLHIFAKLTEFVLTPVIPVICAFAIGANKNIKIMSVPIGINVILQIVSLFNGIVFSVDSANIYHRGSWYFVYMMTFACGVLFLAISCYGLSRNYQYRNGFFLLLIMLLVIAAMLMPLVERSLRLDWACISISSMLFYIYYNELIMQVDALTSLLNRHSYNCRVNNLKIPAAIIFIDVDGFKNINDTFGHQFGDMCLKKISCEITSVFAKNGYCYRFGGDEFCVIITKNDVKPQQLIERLYEKINLLISSESNIPSVSAGYAMFDPSRQSIHDALADADKMMYEQKKQKHLVD